MKKLSIVLASLAGAVLSIVFAFAVLVTSTQPIFSKSGEYVSEVNRMPAQSKGGAGCVDAFGDAVDGLVKANRLALNGYGNVLEFVADNPSVVDAIVVSNYPVLAFDGSRVTNNPEVIEELVEVIDGLDVEAWTLRSEYLAAEAREPLMVGGYSTSLSLVDESGTELLCISFDPSLVDSRYVDLKSCCWVSAHGKPYLVSNGAEELGSFMEKCVDEARQVAKDSDPSQKSAWRSLCDW